jgi:hypothetical protein
MKSVRWIALGLLCSAVISPRRIDGMELDWQREVQTLFLSVGGERIICAALAEEFGADVPRENELRNGYGSGDKTVKTVQLASQKKGGCNL